MNMSVGGLFAGFLLTGLVMFTVAVVFVIVIAAPLSMVGQGGGGGAGSACLPVSFTSRSSATPSSKRLLTVQPTSTATSCPGNKVIVQSARAIVAHLHGDPDIFWDTQMPAQAVNYWASVCPPSSQCWTDWQSGNFQCVTLVTGTYALAGTPLPAARNAIDFWTDYANRSGWSEVPSYFADTSKPRHLPLPGDIMVWWDAPPRVGHVAIVIGVVAPTGGSNGSITFAEANGPGSSINGQFTPGVVTQVLTPDLTVLTWSDPIVYHVLGYIRQNSVYLDLAAQDAQLAGIDPVLFQRQIRQESNFNPDAVSPAGAIGIAQFEPTTAASLHPPLDPTDPVASLAAAAQYMANENKMYGGDDAKALAAYNAGDGAVQQAVHLYGSAWLQHMPQETITYVHAILGGG